MSDELNESTAVPIESDRSHQQDDAIDARVLELVDGYFEQIRAGENPDPEQLIQQNPDLADELRECIESIRLVNPVPHAQSSVANDAVDADSDGEGEKRIGDFRILREVGRGGMGVVYEAEQVSLNRRVALKLLRHAIADPEVMERFQREAETVASLHHSNIVPIFAVGEESGQHYFAMQFIEGESLADIANESELPIETLDIADWGLQTAEALAYSHEHDVIHRDVKPSNLIRDTDGKVWLTDFGLAKRMDGLQLSMTGAILGTPRYMSPEQASSMRRPVDHRTDIYSLGATMYELATGKPLFEAESPHVALGQIISDEPPSPRSIRQTLPLDMDTIITRCISKQVDDRYSTAQELVSDLRAFIDGRAIAARRPSSTERLCRWVKKNRRAISIAAATAALAVVAVWCMGQVAEYYQSAKFAKIRFDVQNSIESPLVAEIHDEHGAEVVPGFTVPTQQKVEIPYGDYDLTLRAKGQLSETYRFSAHEERMSRQELIVRKEERRLWDPRKIEGRWTLWKRADGYDIVIFELNGVRVLDGETSEEIWYADLQEYKAIKEQLAEAGFDWQFSPVPVQTKFRGPSKLIQPKNGSLDVDADGVDDLILACNYFPIVLALSGADGQLIWSRTVAPTTAKSSEDQQPLAGAVIGSPICRDINGDGVSDIVAIYAVNDHENRTTSTISAISGGSGDAIWKYAAVIRDPRHPIDEATNAQAVQLQPMADLAQLGTPSILAQWFSDGPQDLSRNWFQHWGDIVTRKDNGKGISSGELVPFDPEIVKVEDRNELAFVGGRDLYRLDLATGTELSVTSLGFFPACPPRIVAPREPGDSNPAVLLCQQKPTVDSKPQLAVKSIDLISGSEHWSTTVEASWIHCAPNTDAPHNWPLVTDLDRDEVPEIVVPDGSTLDSSVFATTPAGSLQVLDSRTGERRWAEPDTAVNIEYQPNRFVATDDLDGDGTRDVVAVSLYRIGNFSTGEWVVFADVFSGSTGKRLFFMRSPQVSGFHGRLGTIPVFRSVALFGDLLLIDIDRQTFRSVDSGSSVCFSLSQRGLIFIGDEMADPKLVDANNDDALEFVAWRPKARLNPMQGGELIAFEPRGLKSNGRLRDSWQYAGQYLKAIGDVDGDGVDDAFRVVDESRNLNMVSGATGSFVWSEQVGTRSNREIQVARVGTDLDGDGAEDLLVGFPRAQGSSVSPMEAISGRTGQQLWQFRTPSARSWDKMNVLGARDLDADGRSELLVAAQSEPTRHGIFEEVPVRSNERTHLYCLDARNGDLRWAQEMLPGHRSSHSLLRRCRSRIIDTNRDGVLDIVTYGLRDNGTIGLQAFSGADGGSLWKTKTIADENQVTPSDLSKYPWFEAIESKQGTIALLDADYKNVRLFGIDAATGWPRWKWEARTNGGSWNRSIWHEMKGEFGSTVPKHFNTSDGNRIGFWYSAKDESVRFVLLRDEANNAVLEREIQLAQRSDESDVAWRDYCRRHRSLPLDLDNDGVDELLYTTPKQLVARDLDTDEILWEAELPSVLHRINSADRNEDRSVEIVVAVSESEDSAPTLVAFNATGEQTWRQRVEKGRGSNIEILATKDRSIPPRLLQSHDGDYRDSSFSWCVAVKASGEVDSPPRLRPNQTQTAPDPRLVRDLPWKQGGNFVGEMVPALAMSIAFLGLPIYYFGLLSKGQWSLRTMMVAPVVAAIWFSVARLQVAVGGMSPIDPLILNLMLSVYCLPMLIYAYVVVRLAYRQDWKQLRRMMVLHLAVAVVMASGALWTAGYFNETESVRINWTFSGMATILFLSTLPTGALLVLGFVGKRLFKFVARRFGRNAKLATQ